MSAMNLVQKALDEQSKEIIKAYEEALQKMRKSIDLSMATTLQEMAAATNVALGNIEQARATALRKIKSADHVMIFESYVIDRIIESLEEVAKVATMERAQFGGIEHYGKDSDPTPMIREKTRLWRDTWIIEPVEGALKVLKEHKLYDGKGYPFA